MAQTRATLAQTEDTPYGVESSIPTFTEHIHRQPTQSRDGNKRRYQTSGLGSDVRTPHRRGQEDRMAAPIRSWWCDHR